MSYFTFYVSTITSMRERSESKWVWLEIRNENDFLGLDYTQTSVLYHRLSLYTLLLCITILYAMVHKAFSRLTRNTVKNCYVGVVNESNLPRKKREKGKNCLPFFSPLFSLGKELHTSIYTFISISSWESVFTDLNRLIYEVVVGRDSHIRNYPHTLDPLVYKLKLVMGK